MLNKNLKVKIPKKFKKQLIARFSVSKAKKHIFASYENVLETEYVIKTSCPLCKKYRIVPFTIMLPVRCSPQCPFEKFSSSMGGCTRWIRAISDMPQIVDFGTNKISWDLENDKQARKLLKELKTQAKKYIEWV